MSRTARSVGLLAGAAASIVVAVTAGTMGPGETIAASTAAALTAELADTALASVTFALRRLGRWTDAARDLMPVIVASVPVLRPSRRSLGVGVSRHLALDTSPLLRAGFGGSALFPDVPGTVPAHRGSTERERPTQGCEPVVRQGTHRNARCARPLHRRPFSSRCHLRPRYRRRVWGSTRSIRTWLICAV